MMSKPVPILVAGLVLCAAASGIHAQQQFQVMALITNTETGVPATKVEPDNLQIVENGKEAKVVKVEPVNWPAKVQILLDNGVGLGAENLGVVRTALRSMIDALPPTAEITLVTTSPQPRFVVRSSTDRKTVLEGVDRVSPDASTGRFIDSLLEATQRIERDKSDHYPIIVAIGTTAGDANVNDGEIKQIIRRVQLRPTTAHVVILTASGKTLSGGNVQGDTGMQLAKLTNGRYENINSASRFGTLLTEIGSVIAKSNAPEGGRFRITVQRPSGATGGVDKIGVRARGNFVATDITIDAP